MTWLPHAQWGRWCLQFSRTHSTAASTHHLGGWACVLMGSAANSRGLMVVHGSRANSNEEAGTACVVACPLPTTSLPTNHSWKAVHVFVLPVN